MDIPVLSQLKVQKKSFPSVETHLTALHHPNWNALNEFQKQERISGLLLQCIQDSQDRFLLREVADFIERVHQKKLCEQFTISIFETFLNHYFALSPDQNLVIRSKISGKSIPRSEYQTLFPIGMDKYYEGPHFITAHASPDLDTIVSSFWGFVDAFSARVGIGCHIWNVPGGAPRGLIEKEILFTQVFGESFFSYFSKDKSSLSITAFDLLTKKGLKIVHPEALLTQLEEEPDALIITQDDGIFLADWKSSDSENFRRITSALFSVFRDFESGFQHGLIQAYSKENVRQEQIELFVTKALDEPIEKNGAFIELPIKLKNQVHQFLSEVVGLKEGVKTSFYRFFQQMVDFVKQRDHLNLDLFTHLYDPGLFEKESIEEKTKVLKALDRCSVLLKNLMELMRQVFASFRFASATKEKVFRLTDESISVTSDLEEVKARISGYPFITVSLSQDHRTQLPLGVIYAQDLQKSILGTVTCRDFSNKEETKIPPYLEVIAGLDHHKMKLDSTLPMSLQIKDVQSANTLVALEAFKINDRYSFGGIDPQTIDSLIKQEKAQGLSSLRCLQRLFMRKAVMAQSSANWIDPDREVLEYLHFLFAILDDTDLLSKVTTIDLECVLSLLNRLKSIQLKKEVEILHFDDLDRRDPDFLKKGASRLLQNQDLYSLYQTVYLLREKRVTDELIQVLKAPIYPLFEDTKVQNGCARVGQKKLYSSNIAIFEQHRLDVAELWVKESEGVFQKNREIDLHLLMISTVASCEDVFKGKSAVYSHADELWFYVPQTETAFLHLKLFLTQFQRNQKILRHQAELKVTVYGNYAQLLRVCFEESFLECPVEQKEGLDGWVVLHHPAGILNSRKSMISPFLPI